MGMGAGGAAGGMPGTTGARGATTAVAVVGTEDSPAASKAAAANRDAKRRIAFSLRTL
jgi:hypothetical protein